MTKDCLFCKIINKEIPSDIVFENENVVVFRDIKPKAPIHLLIVPKKHIPTANDLKASDNNLLGELFTTAKEVAKIEGVKDSGYRLSINVGEGGGQEIFHLHIHLLGKIKK